MNALKNHFNTHGQGKLMDSSRQVSLVRWFGLSQLHRHVLCLAMLAWILDPALADPVSYSHFSEFETRPLRLGLERTEEVLPFRGGGGKCVYELMEMEEAHWYEVKISYPASTPAIFGIDLLPEFMDESFSSGRKLLNTEKIIFHNPRGSAFQGKQLTRRVLVSVKPEGFVALPFVQEQESIIYNIRKSPSCHKADEHLRCEVCRFTVQYTVIDVEHNHLYGTPSPPRIVHDAIYEKCYRIVIGFCGALICGWTSAVPDVQICACFSLASELWLSCAAVLEEVLLGVPLQAFWVGYLGLIALCISILAAWQMSTSLQPLLEQVTTKTIKRAL